MTDILMPALSPTMEEGKLAKWLVKEGDTVKPGDVIAEIETDKATMEVEAVDEGVVSKLVIPAGTEGVKVNALIAVLNGDAAPAPKKGNGGGAAKAAKSEERRNSARTRRRARQATSRIRRRRPSRRRAMTDIACARRRSLRRRPRDCTIRRCPRA